MSLPKQDKICFVAGTMFIVRSNLLHPFKIFMQDIFSNTQSCIRDGTLAHVFERLFGAIVTAQGCRICPVFQLKYVFYTLLLSIGNFLFMKKFTKQGKTIIKICKIPIYSK